MLLASVFDVYDCVRSGLSERRRDGVLRSCFRANKTRVPAQRDRFQNQQF